MAPLAICHCVWFEKRSCKANTVRGLRNYSCHSPSSCISLLFSQRYPLRPHFSCDASNIGFGNSSKKLSENKNEWEKHFSNQHHWKSQYLTLSFILYSRLVQFFVVLFRDSLLLTLSPAAVRTCSVKAWISRMPNANQRAKRKGTSRPSDFRIVHRALVIKDAEMFFLSWAFQQDPFTDLHCIRGSWLLSSIIMCWKNDFVKTILTHCGVG